VLARQCAQNMAVTMSPLQFEANWDSHARARNRGEGRGAGQNTVKAVGGYFRCSPRPGFKVAICDLRAAFSSLVRTKAKSGGNRSAFRFTCSWLTGPAGSR
jgi:hypothetical protein